MPRVSDADGYAPTQTAATDPGVVMGTAGYMSPEQVRGQTVDHHTDIFAFGAILYEMLSGKPAFRRSTAAETMTAILHDEPPSISQMHPIPPGLQRVVHRCLEKSPEQRFQSASDLAFALDALSDSGASPAVATQAPSRRSRKVPVWSVALVAVFLLAAMAWFEIGNRNGGPPLRVAEYTQLTHNGHAGYAEGTDGSRIYLQRSVEPSMQQVSVSGGEIEPVSSITVPNPLLLDVSPDGSTFLVKSYEKSPASLYAVQVVGGSHRYLADAAGAAWSPDGKLVAYSTADGDINIINSDGTGAHKLASVGGTADDLSWSPDGRTIRFFRDRDYSLWEITSNGANLHPLLAGWHPSNQKCCGDWSPDGIFFAFGSRADRAGTSQIYALDERRSLFQPLAKEPIQLTSGPIRWSGPIVSKSGKKIFATGFTVAGELVRLDPKSNQFQPFLGGISADSVAFSKDGQFIAYVSYPDDVLWRANRDGSDRVPLTSPPMLPNSPKWSPDGTQIVFTDDQSRHACIIPSRGGSPQRLLPEGNGLESDPGWSPDGRKIIFATGSRGSSESSIRIFDLASHQITTLPGSDGKFSPHWSPNGQFIVADSLDVTTSYIFDIQTQHWSTLYKGIGWATWSGDSHFIYFLRSGDDRAILRIPITGGEAKVVVSLKDFPFSGTFGTWFGLDPTDAPLLMRDVSTSDVYALTLEGK